MLLVNHLEGHLIGFFGSRHVRIHSTRRGMFARLTSSWASFFQKVTDVAWPLVRSTHRCPWSNPGRAAMEGAFTSLKMRMHSSIFSGLT